MLRSRMLYRLISSPKKTAVFFVLDSHTASGGTNAFSVGKKDKNVADRKRNLYSVGRCGATYMARTARDMPIRFSGWFFPFRWYTVSAPKKRNIFLRSFRVRFGFFFLACYSRHFSQAKSARLSGISAFLFAIFFNYGF